jgi:predicted nucleic acid-binding protein
MPLRICAIDSSCLQALDCAGLVPHLSILFDRILVPRAVREELKRRPATRSRLKILLEDYAFVNRCDDYDPLSVDILRSGWKRQGKRDRGEAETIIQAARVGAAVLIDDRRARKHAERSRLECHGTLWVLRKFHELELLSVVQLRQALQTMNGLGIRLPREEVNRLLADAGQEPL